MKLTTSSLTLGFCVILVGIASICHQLGRSAGAETPAPSDDRLASLLRARYESAHRLLEMEELRLQEGRSTLPNVCEAGRRVRDSAVELTVSPEERLVALTNYVTLTRRLEDSVNRVVEKGMAPSSDRDLATYLRLDAEIALLRAQAGR